MTTITRSLLLATSLLFSTFLFGQTRYYVNAAATGAGDGSSWGDAFTNLQNALSASQYGDEIWVAQGTYYPTAGTNRNISFELKDGVKMYGGFAGMETLLSQRNWVAHETVLSGDIGVLGDSLDNSFNVVYTAVITSIELNGFTVKRGNAQFQIQGEPMNSRRLNGGGMYIAGAAVGNSAKPYIVNCIFKENNAIRNGGGLFNTYIGTGNLALNVQNCNFTKNNANNGGCIYYEERVNSIEKTIIENSSFSSNSATSGGAIHVLEKSGAGDIQINNCIFIQNSANQGAAITDYDENKSNTCFLSNCTFEENYTDGEGGGIYLSTYQGGQSMTVQNCNFYKNVAFAGGVASAVNFAPFNDDIASISFINCSMYDNNAYSGKNIITGGFDAFFHNCIIENYTTFSNSGAQLFEIQGLSGLTIINSTIKNFAAYYVITSYSNSIGLNNIKLYNCLIQLDNIIDNPRLALIRSTSLIIDNSIINYNNCEDLITIQDYNGQTSSYSCGPNMLYNLDPQFVDPDNGDFHLLPTSPAINAGDNAIVNSLGILTDIEGNPRIQGGTVDIGAYESGSGSNNSGVKYVNTNVQGGNNDGTSWASAYLDLQDALAASDYGDEIWVAQGTYYPTATMNRDIYYELKNGVKLYGGFAGVETDLSERDWVVNETILSGDIGVQGDSTDNSYTILYINPCDSTTLVDGLGFKKGNANIIGSSLGINHPFKSGGAIYIMAGDSSAYPRIYNCIFEYNYAKNNGGAVYGNGKTGSVSPQFHNCTFAFNNANIGGAINIIGKKNFKNVKNDFLNCTFQNNWSITSAGAVELNGDNLAPDNSEHFDTIEFIGCNFINNHTGNTSSGDGDGGGLRIYNDYNNIEVLNCSFTGNSATNGAGISGSLGALSMLIENTSFTDNFCVEGGAAISVRNFNNYDITHWSIINCYFGQNNSNYSILSLVIPFFNFDTLTLKDNIFESNSNGIEMNGLHLTTIDNCRFTNNSTTSFSPLFYRNAKKSILTNNIFSNNKCILFNQLNSTATDTIANCTFYNNLGNVTATQLFGNAYISNCIFNQEIGGNAFPFQSANVTLESSLVLSPDCSNLPAYVTCGTGNIFGFAPVFTDTAGGDFHLLPTSPGINAGNNDVVNALGLTSDYDGNPRIQFCNVDMGAFEALDYEILSVATASSIACSGQPNGSVQFTLLNGCEPYTYLWTNGTATGTGATNLMPGDYTFTITDALGKSVGAQVEVPSYPSIVATLDATPYHCANGLNGTANLTINSGTSPFQVEWYDGSTETSLTNLPPGIYTVTVTDANGCTLTDSVTVGITGSLPVGISISPITCPGDSDGTATVQPIGGTMPFAWLWLGGQTTPTLDSLSGGSYSATVTDALGCTGDIDFTITPPAPIHVDIMVMQPLCFGGMGTATASGTGGTGSLHFEWDNGATTASTMLTEGPHTVTISDISGCTSVETVSIQAPPQLQVALSVEPAVLCHGASNGTITVTPSGGTGQYASSGPVENLSAGTYNITVTDSNGCTATTSATIAEHLEITVTDTVTDASSPTAPDGSIVLNSVTGGTGSGYTFNWSPTGAGNVISTEQNLTGVPTGDYSLTVTDSQGCTAVFDFFVDFNSAAGEAQGNLFGAAIVPNPSGRAGASLTFGQISTPVKISVFDAAGRLVVAEQTSEGSYGLPKHMAAGAYRVVLENKAGRMVLTWVVGE